MTYEHEAVMEAVQQTTLELLPFLLEKMDMPITANQRINLANLIRRDVARRLAVDPKRTQENAA